MKIKRKRYIVMRKNRTEIWGGLAQHYRFRPISDIGEFAIKTYRTEKQARTCSSWDRDFEVVEITETLVSTDHPTEKGGTKTRAITAKNLLIELPAQIQTNRGKNGKLYHHGNFEQWSISGAELKQAIIDIFADENIFRATIDMEE